MRETYQSIWHGRGILAMMVDLYKCRFFNAVILFLLLTFLRETKTDGLMGYSKHKKKWQLLKLSNKTMEMVRLL